MAKPIGDGFVLVDDGVLLDSQAPFVGVIVPEARARGFYWGDHGKTQGYFSPTVEQVLVVAKALRERSWTQYPGIGKRLHVYRYHVVGLVMDGRRVLFLNGFCDARGDWYRKTVSIDDGGDCYFQLSFDPSTNAELKLTVNGEG